MIVKLTQVTLELGAGQVLSLPRADGLQIECRTGRLWITQEGYSQDLWLAAGSSMRIDGPGRVVIEADGQASLRLAPALARAGRAAGYPWAWRLRPLALAPNPLPQG